MQFQDKFPSTSSEHQLNGFLDAAFFSHFRHTLYFVKGQDTFEGVGFSEYHKDVSPMPRHNHTTVQFVDKWFNIWFDICEVSTTTEYVVQTSATHSESHSEDAERHSDDAHSEDAESHTDDAHSDHTHGQSEEAESHSEDTKR